MKLPITRLNKMRLVCATLLIPALLLPCGLIALAAEEPTSEMQQTATLPAVTAPMPPSPKDMTALLYPVDVQTIIGDSARQIIKTYILAEGQNPLDIPRESFLREGWQYELDDIIEKRTDSTETRSHIETVEISTTTNDLSEIIKLLAPTLDYRGEDGYSGLLTLDLSSVSCEVAGYKNSSYTVTSMREYPHLSSADTSLIPKSITDNGRALELDSISWESQRSSSVDYEDIPESYRAVAVYSSKAIGSVAAGYIIAASYEGEVSLTSQGDIVYIAYFTGSETDQTPKPPAPAIDMPWTQNGSSSATILFIILAVIALLLAVAGVYWFLLRHNVKVYKVSDSGRVLVAKDKISVKKPLVDLSPLDGSYFVVQVDRYAAKALNNRTVEVRQGSESLKLKIAYEGNVYSIGVDFAAGTIKAIY